MTEGAPAAYHIVFELGVKDLLLNLLWFILPIAFFAMGFGYVMGKAGKSYLPDHRPEVIGHPVLRRILGVVLMLVSLVMACAMTAVTFGEFLQLRRTLNNGRYQVVEGPVENFVPMPYQGHAAEHFTVKSVPFSYSTYQVISCFNHTSSHGGPIRWGLPVRISYVAALSSYRSNCILRLEVGEASTR